jgi:hypothetical protein
MSDLIQWPGVRETYAGIDNPIFVDDIQAADEMVLAAAKAMSGLNNTDFAIVSGLEFDGTTNYAAGIFYLNGQFYYISTGCQTGQFLSGSVVPVLSEGFNDGNLRNIYNGYVGSASNAGGAGFSPVFADSMDTYRISGKRLMLAVNALQVIALMLKGAAFLDVGQSAGTVAAGDDPRMPYTAPQLDARYAQRVNVIEKGTATAYTPVNPNDPANKLYVDSKGSNRFAAGSLHIGDIGSNGGHFTVSLGVIAPNANYIVCISITSGAPNPYDDASLVYAVKAKTIISFDIYLFEVRGDGQNFGIDFIVFGF